MNSILTPKTGSDCIDEDSSQASDEKKKRMSLVPPKPAAAVVSSKFAKTPCKQGPSALATTRRSVDMVRRESLPELVAETGTPEEEDPVGFLETVSPISLPTEEEDKSKEKEKALTDSDNRPKKDPFFSGDLSRFANFDKELILAPIIDPLPPSARGARSARSRSTALSHRSHTRKKYPSDPAEGWAWANQEQLEAAGGIPLDGLNSGRFTASTGSARHATSSPKSARTDASSTGRRR